MCFHSIGSMWALLVIGLSSIQKEKKFCLWGKTPNEKKLSILNRKTKKQQR